MDDGGSAMTAVPGGAAVLEARGLSVRRGRRWALVGADLDLHAGRILGVIGPPQAGKSTLVAALAGLVPLAVGRVRCEGEELGSAADLRRWRGRIGMSFQNDALFDSLTVWENVAFALRRRRVAEAEIRERVDRRLAEVGLAPAADKLPNELSGGMRKRVGIARATVTEPRVGLFDDPIAGLDPVTGGRILDLVVGLTERLGMATLIVSNDLPVLLPLCSRVMMLHAAEVVYDGEPAGLYASPRPEVVQFATGADVGPL